MIYATFMYLSHNEGASPKEKRAAESEAARELLKALYLHVFKENLPKILKNETGKPFLDGENSHPISISHSAGAVAVAVSDENSPIGIDVEEKISEDVASRIQKRFPFIKKRDFSPINDITLFEAKSTANISFKEISLTPTNQDCFGFYWTACESVLKAEGGGLASHEKLDCFEKSCEVSSFLINDFYLSVSKINTDCK